MLSPTGRRASWELRGTRANRRLKSFMNLGAKALPSCMLLTPARRSFLTRRSWSVRFILSTRPLDWAVLAQMMSMLSWAKARPNWVTPLLMPVVPSWGNPEDAVLVAVERHRLAVVAQIRQRRREVVEGRLRLREAQLHQPPGGVVDVDQQAASSPARAPRTRRAATRRSGPTRPGSSVCHSRVEMSAFQQGSDVRCPRGAGARSSFCQCGSDTAPRPHSSFPPQRRADGFLARPAQVEPPGERAGVRPEGDGRSVPSRHRRACAKPPTGCATPGRPRTLLLHPIWILL